MLHVATIKMVQECSKCSCTCES